MQWQVMALKDVTKDVVKRDWVVRRKDLENLVKERVEVSFSLLSGSIVPTSPLIGDIIVPYPEEPAKVKGETSRSC